MKKLIFSNIVFILFAIFISCSKDKQTLINSTWVVESVKVHADSALMYRSDSSYFMYLPDSFIVMHWKEPITLSFPKKNEYIFKAETTTSSGKVNIVGNKINFKGAMTIGDCCDSPFADACFDLFLGCGYCYETCSINTYVINGNKLIFKGDKGEEINFIKQ